MESWVTYKIVAKSKTGNCWLLLCSFTCTIPTPAIYSVKRRTPDFLGLIWLLSQLRVKSGQSWDGIWLDEEAMFVL
jgi:hypothetical protein